MIRSACSNLTAVRLIETPFSTLWTAKHGLGVSRSPTLSTEGSRKDGARRWRPCVFFIRTPAWRPGMDDESRPWNLLVSHPFDRRKSKEWGTEVEAVCVFHSNAGVATRYGRRIAALESVGFPPFRQKEVERMGHGGWRPFSAVGGAVRTNSLHCSSLRLCGGVILETGGGCALRKSLSSFCQESVKNPARQASGIRVRNALLNFG